MQCTGAGAKGLNTAGHAGAGARSNIYSWLFSTTLIAASIGPIITALFFVVSTYGSTCLVSNIYSSGIDRAS